MSLRSGVTTTVSASSTVYVTSPVDSASISGSALSASVSISGSDLTIATANSSFCCSDVPPSILALLEGGSSWSICEPARLSLGDVGAESFLGLVNLGLLLTSGSSGTKRGIDARDDEDTEV
jgi:hypothetical protein